MANRSALCHTICNADRGPPIENAQRSIAIDIVRVTGVVAVATGHLWGGSVGSVPNTVRLAVYPWHVPLFFFLSGYFWTFGRPLAGEASGRARSLLVPFAIWTVLLGVPIFTVLALQGNDPVTDILSTLWGGGLLEGPFAPYWFLPVLFFAAVLTRALERVPRWVSWAAAAVGVFVCYPFGGHLSRLPHDVAFAFPCLLFVLAGQELGRHQKAIRHPALVGAAGLVVSATLVGARLSHPLDIKVGDFGTPVLSVFVAVLICGSLVLVARALLDQRLAKVRPLVSAMATTLVVVLLTHTFLFAALVTLSTYAVPISRPLVFVFGLTLAWAIALGIHRTPLSQLFAGVPRRPRATRIESGGRADRVRHDVERRQRS